MKTGAIFDMDGLLFDTEVVYNEEWKIIADKHNLEFHPEMLDQMRGMSGASMYKVMNTYWPDIDAEQITKEFFEDARETMKWKVPVKPGVEALLEYFKENGVKCAVASSSPLDLILSNLRVAHIDSYFDVVVSGQQVVHGKPAPDIFLLAASKLGFDPHDCYVFEDGPNGLHAGVAAGCSTIMVPDLIKPTEELHEICTGIYPTLEAVMEAIKQGKC